MTTHHGLLLAILGLATLATGCHPMAKLPPPVVDAQYTTTPIVVDGRLDDPVWANAPTYPLNAMVLDGKRACLHEGGRARFAWDDKFFYAALQFEDSDVVAEGNTNGQEHIRLGDVGEVFLKPEGSPWYWEMHVTPRGNQTSYFMPSGGRRLPSCKQTVHRLTVAAQVNGTLNDPRDRDHGWTAEMAVPLAILAEHGEQFGPDTRWRVFVGRYNFSVNLDSTELSSMPEVSQVNFHLTKEYAKLRLLPAKAH